MEVRFPEASKEASMFDGVPERRRVEKTLVPLQVFESANSVDEAKVQVEVAKEYRRPPEVTPTPPAESPVR